MCMRRSNGPSSIALLCMEENMEIPKKNVNPSKEEKHYCPKGARVPRIYEEAAKALKKVNEGAGVRDTVFKLNHPNVRGIYALTCKAIKYDQVLEHIITKTGMLYEKFNPNLAKILVTELLWGRQELKGDSKAVKQTLKFEEALKKALKESPIPPSLAEVLQPKERIKQISPKERRIPKIYEDAAKLLKKVIEGAGLRSELFRMNYPSFQGLYALTWKALKNDQLLENLIKQTEMLNEKFNPNLLKILVAELLWGTQELKGEGQIVKQTLKSEEALREALKESPIPACLTEEKIPQYFRINTLKVAINSTIQRLIDDGWHQEDTPETYEAFLKCASDLGEMQFMKDYHFDDLLVFPSKSNMHEHALVENGSLVLQDKASCIPALVLDPKPGSVVLDMCAAPGLKTSQLASILNNKGTVFAVDRDNERFEAMKLLVERNCMEHNCVTMKLADSVNLTSEDCPGVRYILIDPTCSESGMLSKVESQENDIPPGRIKSLGCFQKRLLVQAMTAFPDVERIVYSTCSLFEEENEQVVAKILERVPSFQVVPPQLEKPWERRGNPKYPFGSHCLVADVEKDQTNGLFVAILERIPGMDHSSGSMTNERKRATLDETKHTDEEEIPKKKNMAETNEQQMQVDNNDQEAT